MDIATVAGICHEVNRAYCEAIGDLSQPPWHEAPEWQRASAIDGVQHHLAGDVSPRESHERWLSIKIADGWTYGPVKDPALKQHPCVLPYDELPLEQKVKDYLFRAVVASLKQHVDGA